jgi:Raf kinase inhibitor-like YbhB/YbcL family protein
LAVTSSSFPSNGAIPIDETCDGANRSPQLSWSAPPAGTQTFAIVADDPDAPSGTFTHWIAYNLSADLRAMPEGADPSSGGGATGTNDFGHPAYEGPCPPRGQMHRYFFHVFALNARVDPPPLPARDAIVSAMSGHVLAEGALMGVYSR